MSSSSYPPTEPDAILGGHPFRARRQTPRPLPPGTWPKASDEGYFKNLISGGRKHSWECSALPSSGGRKHSCECKRPLGCYTRPPNSTLSLPFPGMTNTLYTIGPLIKVSREGNPLH